MHWVTVGVSATLLCLFVAFACRLVRAHRDKGGQDPVLAPFANTEAWATHF